MKDKVRSKIEPAANLHEELFIKALRMFKKGGNARLINTCMERMKKNAIEITNEDNGEKMVADQSQGENMLEQSNTKEKLDKLFKILEMDMKEKKKVPADIWPNT